MLFICCSYDAVCWKIYLFATHASLAFMNIIRLTQLPKPRSGKNQRWRFAHRHPIDSRIWHRGPHIGARSTGNEECIILTQVFRHLLGVRQNESISSWVLAHPNEFMFSSFRTKYTKNASNRCWIMDPHVFVLRFLLISTTIPTKHKNA